MSEKRERGENEVSCWTVAVGNLPLPPFVPRKSKKAIKFITGLEGFVGFNPQYPYGTLCLFKSENEAKSARNLMITKGIQVGNNICEVYVDKACLKEGKANEDNTGDC